MLLISQSNLAYFKSKINSILAILEVRYEYHPPNTYIRGLDQGSKIIKNNTNIM